MISPRLPPIGLFDFHRADEMIECGAAAAQREIEHIKREIIAQRINSIYAHAG
jgi:hypothetical protein